MSTRSNKARGYKAAKTDPKWYPTTQGLNRWLNRLADRKDLTVRVLKQTSGAPARFVPDEAEIDLNEALISRVDPLLAGSPEFVVKHRAIAGACVHEAAHARYSRHINLDRIAKTYGDRHVAVFLMLEEGRCESLQWPHLNGVERIALQSMVLDIVLQDMQDEDGNIIPMDLRGVVRLCGLLAARIDRGIMDVSQPKGERVHAALLDVLGADYGVLHDIAVRFSKEETGYWTSGEERLHDLVRQWIEVEDRLTPPPEDGGGGGKGGDEGECEGAHPDGGDDSSDDGDDSSDDGSPGDRPDPKGEGDKGKGGSGSKKKETEEDGDGSAAGGGTDEGEEDGETPLPGDDDNGTVGDGSTEATEGGDDTASLGDYASTTAEGMTFEDLLDVLREAASEAEVVGGSRLHEEVIAIHRATAASHSERRRNNAAAAKRWRR